MNELKKLIRNVVSQLYASALLRCILISASSYVLASTILFYFGQTAYIQHISILFAVLGFATGVFITRIYQDKKAFAVALIHQTIGGTEYSIDLLEKDQLNIAEQLQIGRLLENNSEGFDFPVRKLYEGTGFYLTVFVISLILFFTIPKLDFSSSAEKTKFRNTLKIAPAKLPAPVLKNARVLISPPTYTRLPAETLNDLNISAIAGSLITWQIKFDRIDSLFVRLANSRGEELQFRQPEINNGPFTHKDQLTSSGLYSIRAYWSDSLVYQSDFYRIEAVADKAPVIEPLSKELYQYHHYKDNPSITVQARMSDDFSIDQAFIVATVAKGSGENVKFREVRFPLDKTGFRQSQLGKTIDLKALNFSPGDELYYYWAATDNKRPEANFTKSDTYFIVYKDTTAMDGAELATMALDIMPEYFRSQRQILIDTKKLIAKRKKMPRADFNTTSNEIGFDQKVLRLRYGQYLGEEFESNIGGSAIPDEDEGNILASFEHKSDASEEDGFRQQKKAKEKEPDHAHEDAHGHGEEKDPLVAILEQFGHSHDDDEMNTFYEESTKNMLKMALEQMWQSELHLRMFEPEKAIPYETKALEYLKSAQQKVRAFVKKSGFDPPPIKEKEKRLTGELTDMSSKTDKSKTYDKQKTAQLAAEVLAYLEYDRLDAAQLDKIRFAGFQLSEVILNNKNGGLKDWTVLKSLQKLMAGKALNMNEKEKLRASLFTLTDRTFQKGNTFSSDSKLESAFWQSIK